MAKFRKMHCEVEAITFDELIQYGKENGDNIVDGMPWSFNYKGHPVSHENDDCYIIVTRKGGVLYIERDDVLVVDNCNVNVIDVETFKATHKLIPDNENKTRK